MADNHWNETANSEPAPQSDKAWALLERVVTASVREQRRARRWGIFFKLLTFTYLIGVSLWLALQWQDAAEEIGYSGPHVALVEVRGAIADEGPASADLIVSGLRKAFANAAVKGVILRINSPGGSPVQAGYVYDEIRRLRSLHPETKLYAVIADMGASGAYYIAAAADEIYADKASMVGSIGVITSSFGFADALEKLGIERRLLTAGENKGFMDPFSPMSETQERFWQSVLDSIHQQFIGVVKQGRGERLRDDPQIFSGLIWNGEQALELGLVDGLGSASFVAREVIGYDKIVDYTPQPTPFERFSRRFGVVLGEALAREMAQVEVQLR